MTAPVRKVLLITLDQWRADGLSAVGGVARTPCIDALAGEGVLFGAHYSVAAPCAPARASLLTGRYLHNHGVARNGDPLDPRLRTLAQAAAEAGLTPLLFGFTDTTLVAGQDGVSMAPGFIEGLHLPGDAWPWIDWLEARGYARPASARDIWRPAGERCRVDDAPTIYGSEESEGAFLTGAATRFIRRHAAEDWLIHLSYFRPHPPHIAPAPYNRMYDPDASPAPRRAVSVEAEAAAHPWLAARLGRQMAGAVPVQDQLPMSGLDDAGIAQLRATYYGSISECDARIGQVMAALEDCGLKDQTLVILTADHGDMLGDHWLWGAESPFEEAFHVPLLIRHPCAAGAAGRRIDAFTESVDIMPTILEAVGLEPGGLDGRSLLPWLQGETPGDWRDAAHWEMDLGGLVGGRLGPQGQGARLAAIRTQERLYLDFDGLPPLLYDLAGDPAALRDRAADPAMAADRRLLAQRLAAWRVADGGPLSEPPPAPPRRAASR